MFSKVLVANRGAVASRVLRALNEMGVHSVAVYSEADAGAPYLGMASETYAIGPAPARESYLNQDLIVDILKKSHADGLHPGYGFLSENAGFAQRVIDAGSRFIGPSPKCSRSKGWCAPDVLPLRGVHAVSKTSAKSASSATRCLEDAQFSPGYTCSPMRLHIGAQQRVHSGLITSALPAKPLNDVGIDTQRK